MAGCADLPEPGPSHSRGHRDAVAHFNRFPHCNPVLGRETTPDEAAWMANGGLAGWLQAGSGALGAASMAGGLGLYLAQQQDERIVPIAIAGSLLTVLAMLMFLGLVLVDMFRVRRLAHKTPAQTG